jgi:hypothetical protein
VFLSLAVVACGDSVTTGAGGTTTTGGGGTNSGSGGESSTQTSPTSNLPTTAPPCDEPGVTPAEPDERTEMQWWYDWENRSAADLAADPSANLIISGAEFVDPGTNGPRDPFIDKRDPEYGGLWTWDPPCEYSLGVTTDDAENVFTAGCGELWKLDAGGTSIWSSEHAARAASVAVAQDGSIVVAGHTNAPGEPTDAWMGKYDPEGGELWTVTHDGGADADDSAADVATDSAGNVIVVGEETVSEPGGTRKWIAKYGPEGVPEWMLSVDFPPGEGTSGAEGVAVDSQDNIVVTGSVSSTCSSHNIWVRKHDPDGEELWTRMHDDKSHGKDQGLAVAVDGSDNVIAAGTAYLCNPVYCSQDLWLRKYTSEGDVVWTESIAFYYDDDDSEGVVEATAVAADANGDVVVIGTSKHADEHFYNLIIAKYDG